VLRCSLLNHHLHQSDHVSFADPAGRSSIMSLLQIRQVAHLRSVDMQPARFKLHAEERTCNPVQRPNFRGQGTKKEPQKTISPRGLESPARENRIERNPKVAVLPPMGEGHYGRATGLRGWFDRNCHHRARSLLGDHKLEEPSRVSPLLQLDE
jgi:hypothetical protein